MESDDFIVLSESFKEVTIFPQVRDLLDAFIALSRQVDPECYEGLYLTGSITQQDFHPSKSDVDFVVLCREFPSDKLQKQIVKIHKAIEKRFHRTTLNGWYITNASLAFDPRSNVPALLYEKGKLCYDPFGISPMTLYELSTNGYCIFGTRSNELSINVSQRDVVDFLFRNINSYWTNWIDRHSKWPTGKLLLVLFPRFTEWVILGIARQYFTLKTGTVASKTKAGHYALQDLPKEYHEIIGKAIHIRNEDHIRELTFKNSYSINPSFKRYYKTIECARFIIRQFNADYKKTYSDV